MIILSSSAGKPCPQRPQPPPPPTLPIQPSFILQRFVVIKNGPKDVVLFLCKGQLLVFLVLFRAIWALEEFDQSDISRKRASVKQILPKCNRLRFTGIVLNSNNFLFPSLSEERTKALQFVVSLREPKIAIT